MIRPFSTLRYVLLATLVFAATAMLVKPTVFAQATPAAIKPGVLTRAEAAAILPDKVFYRGQSATIQGRNSGGIRLSDGKLVLFTLVDTSGYSTSVQETYQAYLISEVTLHLGDQTLAPGAYGFGFISGDKMVIMDLGANQLMQATIIKDAALARPTPLQLLADTTANHYRLYLGRSYITLAPDSK